MIVTRAGSGEPYLATVAAKSVCTGVLVHILGTLDNLRTQHVVALVENLTLQISRPRPRHGIIREYIAALLQR